MSFKLSEAEKNNEYARGVSDGAKGNFKPPEGDRIVDFVFAPLDFISGTPSTAAVAEVKSPHYRAGFSAGSKT